MDGRSLMKCRVALFVNKKVFTMGPRPEQLVFVWLILTCVSFFAMIFGLKYLNNRENMAMIEKGMEPKLKPLRPRPAPFRSLKWGLLFLGAGLGLFTAFLLDNTLLYKMGHDFHPDGYTEYNGANLIMYFALTAVGGGLGLIVSYLIEKKQLLDKE